MVSRGTLFLSSLCAATAATGLMSPAGRAARASTRLLATNRLLGAAAPLRNAHCALRHGRSLANEAGLISSRPGVATVRHGLGETGRTQAEKAGQDLVALYRGGAAAGPWDGIAILASDYLRAKETAIIAARAVLREGLPLLEGEVIIERRLRERWFGEWDGGSDQHYSDVWKHDKDSADHTLRGVESVNSVMDRTTECVMEWDSKLQNHLIVLVAHGDVLQITQTAFAKLDGTEHRSLEHLETATLRMLELAP